ncbi:MAG: hypothetical protein ACE5I1_12125 [bacterium]
MAPLPTNFRGVFEYIQKIWGFISPGIVAVFVLGLIFRRAPLRAAMAAMLLGIPLYGLFLWLFPQVAFLNHMALTFAILIAVMGGITYLNPLPEPVTFKPQTRIEMSTSPFARIAGMGVILVTILLYIVFW